MLQGTKRHLDHCRHGLSSQQKVDFTSMRRLFALQGRVVAWRKTYRCIARPLQCQYEIRGMLRKSLLGLRSPSAVVWLRSRWRHPMLLSCLPQSPLLTLAPKSTQSLLKASLRQLYQCLLSSNCWTATCLPYSDQRMNMVRHRPNPSQPHRRLMPQRPNTERGAIDASRIRQTLNRSVPAQFKRLSIWTRHLEPHRQRDRCRATRLPETASPTRPL